MLLISIWAVVALGVLLFVAWRVWVVKKRRELFQHCIEPDELHELLEPEPKVMVFDVRQPLDVLAYSEIIPGAKRIAPKEVLKNPAVIPKEQDVVIYCTCPGEKTSWEILRRAKNLQYTRIKLLHGGLAAWKAKGYAVERYMDSFRLDTV
ncbi:rhodanese-like domain-containing protein [Edaphobacter aggregans]|uniref:rhodanese-like domain-containing protein n=1 Tax=Edaphobacter aggregans TaxID=570835 RepID=UPI000559620D|nr:rhodanese-like domain-containing protein [Edaphobacter aggregans]